MLVLMIPLRGKSASHGMDAGQLVSSLIFSSTQEFLPRQCRHDRTQYYIIVQRTI